MGKENQKSVKKQIIISITSLVAACVVLTCGISIYIWDVDVRSIGLSDILVAVAFIAATIIISAIVTGKLADKIVKPLDKFANRLKDLAEGDVHTGVEIIDRDDEVGLLSKSVTNLVSELNSMISEITRNLVAIDDGDFTVTLEREYPGDFKSMGEAINRINLRLNRLMTRLIDSSDKVANGANQVASSALALSQATTEQASSIQELAATINELSDQTNQNANNAGRAKKASEETAVEVNNGSRQMVSLVSAMEEIKGASIEISKIIKAIDDIAFQTNILALNAAVEAARAGSAGKGFAVVADEVRNLASKSAEAAKTTTQLIEDSLKAVENGAKIVEETEKSLKLIVEKVNTTVSLVEEIAAASDQQAQGTSQVSIGINQISSVIQTNSATSEESAAASEELRDLAQMLRGLVDGIKLRDVESYNID
jgi:methyl-accepting chemotaxis protein